MAAGTGNVGQDFDPVGCVRSSARVKLDVNSMAYIGEESSEQVAAFGQSLSMWLRFEHYRWQRTDSCFDNAISGSAQSCQ